MVEINKTSEITTAMSKVVRAWDTAIATIAALYNSIVGNSEIDTTLTSTARLRDTTIIATGSVNISISKTSAVCD